MHFSLSLNHFVSQTIGVSFLNFGVIEITAVRQRSTETTFPALNTKLDKALEPISLDHISSF